MPHKVVGERVNNVETAVYLRVNTTIGPGLTLKEIFSFWTGLESIPPLGISEPLRVEFLPSGRRFCLPQSNACFCKIKIPIKHTELESFQLKMNQDSHLSI